MTTRGQGARAGLAEASPAVAPPPGSSALIRLVPAPGSVHGLDEGATRLTVFRTLDAGSVLGREVSAGARIVVSRQAPAVGDVAVFATRRAIGLCALAAPPRGARIRGGGAAVIA